MTVPKRIGIAVVEVAGNYLIGTRGAASPLAGYAEFPGGKCLPDEAPEECTIRECREETGLAITVDRLLLQREFTYAHATVDLHFFLCHPEHPTMIANEYNGFRWVPAHELGTLKFPEANEPVLALLINRKPGTADFISASALDDFVHTSLVRRKGYGTPELDDDV